MLVKNQEYIGIVEDIGMNGEGIIRNEDTICFVPFAITGEKIKYKILKVDKRIAYGKVIEIFTPAEERVRPKCPIFGKCGGCDLQHVKYIEQLKIKEKKVKTCLKKIAFIEPEFKSYVKSDIDFRYRNKLQLPVGEGEDGTVIGFYATNSHRIVPANDCMINPEWTANIISSFKSYMGKMGLKGYNELTGDGDIREITVKEVKGHLIVTAVIIRQTLPNLDGLIDLLKQNLKEEFSLFLNINNGSGNFVYGDEFKLIYGAGSYYSEMLGIKYKMGVRSFSQVNTDVCEKLYSAVTSSIISDENTTVIDAYSGAGLMTALLAKRAKKAIGIEVVKEAVDIANQLAKENGLENIMTNYCGKCEELLPKIIEKEKKEGNRTAIVIDPPRKGCEIEVINAIKESQSDCVVYVSCKPSTLARDIGLLVGNLEVKDGEIKRVENPKPIYKVDWVRIFDMFPQTKHVETVVVMSKM